jgi:hypothetical protein
LLEQHKLLFYLRAAAARGFACLPRFVNFVFLRVAAFGSIPAKTIAWMKSFYRLNNAVSIKNHRP